MAEKDLPSGSDESDTDFVPEGIIDDLSEEESGDDSHQSNSEDDSSSKRRAHQKHKKAGARKKKKVHEETNDGLNKEKPKSETIDINKIWADFKKDVNKPKVKDHSKQILSIEQPTSSLPESACKSIAEGKEEPSSKKPRLGIANSNRGGLSSILGQLGQKNKQTMLEKSKQDWNSFKRREGIEDDLKTFNRGRDGYLEKQDFLERSDVRQFEIEKQLRATKKSNR